MLKLGTKAPAFSLPDTEGKTVSLADFDDRKALLVIFMCNHCPFVIHVREKLAEIAREYQAGGGSEGGGVGVVGINANDIANYPEDAPEKMAEEKRKAGYTFPYLYDETQEVAKAYHAACTPDFYVFDRDRRLAYRGQMDNSRPNSGLPVTGKDLCAALDAVLEGHAPSTGQMPSMGCNIKWKPGNEPDYFRV